MRFLKSLQGRGLVWVFLVVMVISGLAHGVNMFGFPYYENDEGVYVSQAWSVASRGQLAPYTYWYDHAPAGWIFLSIWQGLVGLFAFGSSVGTGRAFMLILHLASSGMLFYVVKKTSGKNLAAALAVLMFSLSPLAIYFQRRVLLDNMVVFWVLAAVSVLLWKGKKLWPTLLAGVLAGVAVLTKEVAVFFLPGFLYMVWSGTKRSRSMSLGLWLTVCGLVIAIYPLYALLKGELLPVGFGGDNTPRVSLLGTLGEQLGRGVDKPFWSKESLFYDNWVRWQEKDRALIWLGGLGVVAAGILSMKKKELRGPVILALGIVLFLLNSSLVIDFYIVPLIPMAAWCYGAVVSWGVEKFKRGKELHWAGGLMAVLFTVAVFGLNNLGQWHKDETRAAKFAVDYVKENLHEDSVIVADSAIYLDLKEARFEGDREFKNVEWAWKVERDREIYEGRLQGDWRNIDYMVLSHEILKQIREFGANYLKSAFDNSEELVLFDDRTTSFLDFNKYISTNGDWMAVVEVKDDSRIVLDQTWNYYKNNFIKSYGQVVDPKNKNTTSEGQSYAMLRAVWQDDQETFDGVWAWTKDHMQFRREDKLFSWLWVEKNGQWVQEDYNTASDADIDIATALLFAHKRWGEAQYLREAKVIISDIWRSEVVAVNGRYYLISGSGIKKDSGYLINPSYFSPAAYRMFAQVNPENGWSKLTEDTYWLLERIQSNSRAGLVPNWLWVHETSGALSSGQGYVTAANGNDFGFDAFRTFFRVYLDIAWNDDPRGKRVLERAHPFLAAEWSKNKKMAAIYSMDGTSMAEYASLSPTVGALSVMLWTEPGLAKEIYRQELEKNGAEEVNGYWGEADNYYDQNWAWFGVAAYNYKLKNWWIN